MIIKIIRDILLRISEEYPRLTWPTFKLSSRSLIKGSLTAAAETLGRSLQSISRSLAALEAEIGVALIRRTTRRLSATEAGLSLHRRLKPALAEIEDATAEAKNQRTEPRGLLRITGSTASSALYLTPAIEAFLRSYPKVEVELESSDRYVDPVEEALDLAVRIGEMADSSLRARRLATLRRVIFGAPDYFARHGHPWRVEDLTRHSCIIHTAAREGDAWPFMIKGKTRRIKVTGRFRTSAASSVNAASVLGLGIANAPLWQVRELVDAGKVELVLTRFEPATVPVYAVTSASRLPSATVRVFVEFLADSLKARHL